MPHEWSIKCWKWSGSDQFISWFQTSCLQSHPRMLSVARCILSSNFCYGTAPVVVFQKGRSAPKLDLSLSVKTISKCWASASPSPCSCGPCQLWAGVTLFSRQPYLSLRFTSCSVMLCSQFRKKVQILHVLSTVLNQSNAKLLRTAAPALFCMFQINVVTLIVVVFNSSMIMVVEWSKALSSGRMLRLLQCSPQIRYQNSRMLPPGSVKVPPKQSSIMT